jgi:hypothetical protein
MGPADAKKASMVLRIYDFRQMSDDDIGQLKLKLASNIDASLLSRPDNLHQRLDWANLRVETKNILYCIEWHIKGWPSEVEPEIGFK